MIKFYFAYLIIFSFFKLQFYQLFGIFGIVKNIFETRVLNKIKCVDLFIKLLS